MAKPRAKVRRQIGEAVSDDEVLFGAVPSHVVPLDRHYFVGDATGSYCLACNLPRVNRRHVPKAA